MKYGIFFPSGAYSYQHIDKQNANEDVYLVFEDTRIYVLTLFTVENIVFLMNHNSEAYFWASDMVILKNLERDTILSAIKEIVENGQYSTMGTAISTYVGWSIHKIINEFDKESWLLELS